MMNSPIRFILAVGVFCALLPGRASSLSDSMPDNPPTADSLAVPVVDSLAVAAADSLSDDAPFLLADPMPAFNGGGVAEFCHWVQERLVYPDEALESCISGRVVIAFVVECDGSLGGMSVMKTPDRVLSDAVMRVMRESPLWKPGMRDGKPVRVQLVIPIDFAVHAETVPEPTEEIMMPTFQGGGVVEFKRWVLRNLKLEDDVFQPGDEGWVDAEFSVNKKGRVRKVDTPAFSDIDFANRVRKAISSSPDWVPAEKPYDVSLRMRFNLMLHRTPEGLRSEDYTVYKQADKLPLFCGQANTGLFREWAYKQVDSLLGPSVSAPPVRIIVNFVVERDGTVTGIIVSSTKQYAAFSKLVRRAIDDIPRWTPAELAGEKVRFRISQILDFREPEKPHVKDSTVVLDVEPKFHNGGLMEFRRWVMESVRYPAEALQAGIQGRVVVTFVVETDGTVTSVRTIQTPSLILSEEVERAMRLAPRWTPGMAGGEPVAVKFTLPVDFHMDSTGKAASSLSIRERSFRP